MDTKAMVNVAVTLQEMLKDYDTRDRFNINLDNIQEEHAREVIARLATYIIQMGNIIELHDHLVTEDEMNSLLSLLKQLEGESKLAVNHVKDLREKSLQLADEANQHKAARVSLAAQNAVLRNALSAVMIRMADAEDVELNGKTLEDLSTIINKSLDNIKPVA